MNSASLASLIGMLIFVFTMVHSAVTDLVSFRIRNRILVLALLAYGVLAPIAGRGAMEMLLGVAVAAAVLLVGFCLFSVGWIGGGDAKLASVTSLWCGADLTVDYVLYTSLIGGLLTLGILALRAQPAGAWLERTRWVAQLRDRQRGVPYGVAMAMAGLLVLGDTLWSGSLGGL